MNGSIPVAELTGLRIFGSGRFEIRKTKKSCHKLFFFCVDAGNRKDIANGMPVFCLPKKKMLKSMTSIKKKLILSTGDSEGTKRGDIFRG